MSALTRHAALALDDADAACGLEEAEEGDDLHMQVLTIALSTFLGAAVALVSARLTRAYDARLAQEAALNNLILDLAAKRAFLVEPDWVWADGEVGRVVDSINHARQLIRDTRLALTPRSWALPLLREMTRVCNSFIEASEREGDEDVKVELQKLSSHMSEQVRLLHQHQPRRIYGDLPGSFSLHTRT